MEMQWCASVSLGTWTGNYHLVLACSGQPKGLSAAKSHKTSMAGVQDTLCLQLQEKITTPLVPLTSGLTKGPPVLGEPLFCHPNPSCNAHSLTAEEHPGLGSSWTGAASNTATDKSTGGILGRMMHHTGSGLLSCLLFAVSDI